MKKYISALGIVLSLFVCFPAKAEVPAGTFFFQDGKGYDLSGTQTYFCFADNSCYDLQGLFSFVRDAQTQITNLQNKVDNLQNTVNQLQTPVVGGTSTSTPSVPVPVQVAVNDLLPYFISSAQTTAGVYDSYYNSAKNNKAQIGDIYTLIFDGKTYIKTFDGTKRMNFSFGNISNADNGGSVGVFGEALIPGTNYPFTLRVDRGSQYGIATGTISTLVN